jgi:hypothetical protein
VVGGSRARCRMPCGRLLLTVRRAYSFAVAWCAVGILIGAAIVWVFLRQPFEAATADVIYAPGESKVSADCQYWGFRTKGSHPYGLFTIEGRVPKLIPDPGSIKAEPTSLPPGNPYATAQPSAKSKGIDFDSIGVEFDPRSARPVGHTLGELVGGPINGSSLSGDLSGFGRRAIHDENSNRTFIVTIVFRADSINVIENKLRIENCVNID